MVKGVLFDSFFVKMIISFHWMFIVELRGYVEACKGQSISGIGKKGKDGKFRLVESTTFHQFCDSFRCVD